MGKALESKNGGGWAGVEEQVSDSFGTLGAGEG